MTCTEHRWLKHWSIDDPLEDDGSGQAMCAWCQLDAEWHLNARGERISTIRGRNPTLSDHDDFVAWLDA